MIPTVHATAIGALERAINQALKLDPTTLRALEPLEGKVIQVEIKGTPLNLYLIPSRQGLQLRGFLDGGVDSHVTGTLADFTELLSSDDAPSTLINGGISIRGDSAPLLQLLSILHRLEIDWEASLARLIGDIPAHEIGRAVRNGLAWGKQAVSSIGRQAEEFLHEEARLVPPEAEMQGLFKNIQQLNLAVDRFEARLERQRQKIAALQARHR